MSNNLGWDSLQKPRGPVLGAGKVGAFVRKAFPAGAELVLAESTTLEKPALQRWIIGAAGEPFQWRECWVPPKENVWAELRAAGFETTWATSVASGRVVPAAVHSWSFLWTDGTGPLRVWKRQWDKAVTLIDLGATPPRGHVFRMLASPPTSVGPARIKRTWHREACVLETSGGEVEVVSCWRLEALFHLLAEFAGALDPEYVPGAPVEELVERINRAVGEG